MCWQTRRGVADNDRPLSISLFPPYQRGFLFRFSKDQEIPPFPQLFKSRRSESPRHSDQRQGWQESDVSHTVRAPQYDQIEKIGEISVHVGGIAMVQRTTGTETETGSRKISSSRFLGSMPGSGNRWWLVPAGVCLVPVLRLAVVSPCLVLGRLMLCSRGSRV